LPPFVSKISHAIVRWCALPEERKRKKKSGIRAPTSWRPCPPVLPQGKVDLKHPHRSECCREKRGKREKKKKALAKPFPSKNPFPHANPAPSKPLPSKPFLRKKKKKRKKRKREIALFSRRHQCAQPLPQKGRRKERERIVKPPARCRAIPASFAGYNPRKRERKKEGQMESGFCDNFAS